MVNIQAFDPIPKLGYPWIENAVWSPDGTQLALSHGPSLWLCNAENFKFIRHLYDIEYDTFQLPYLDSLSDVAPIFWTPDGQGLIVGEGHVPTLSDDYPLVWSVRYLSLNEQTAPRTLYHNDYTSPISIVADADYSQFAIVIPPRFAAKPDTIHVIEGKTGIPKFTLDNQVQYNSLEWVLNNTCLLTHSRPLLLPQFDAETRKYVIEGNFPNHVQLWDGQTGQLRRTFPNASEYITNAAISADKKRACISNIDGITVVWDLATGTTDITLEGFSVAKPQRYEDLFNSKSVHNFVGYAQWNPAGDVIFGVTRELPKGRFWDAATGQQLAKFDFKLFEGNVAWSPDGRWLANSQDFDGVVTIYRVPTGEVVNQLGGLKMLDDHYFKLLQWRPDGHQLLAIGRDGDLKIWDTSDPDPSKWQLRLDHYSSEYTD